MRPKIYFILGGPGSGKGTQCSLLQSRLNWKHLSAGQLLRNAVNTDSVHKKTIQDIIDTGRIVPSHVTISLLKAEIDKNHKQTYLIDGFPRNRENLDQWIASMSVDFKGLIHLVCPQDVLVQRIMERAKLSGRSDDNLDVLQKRFKTYNTETLEVVKYYSNEVIEVDSNNSIENIYSQILSSI